MQLRLSLPATGERKGVVYTRPWVVNLILDLVGYDPHQDLARLHAVEPAAGEGAFLFPMIRRLLDSLDFHSRRLVDAVRAVQAYELDEESAAQAADVVTAILRQRGATLREANRLVHRWITVKDYLLAAPTAERADFVIGNPPYIRYDDLPASSFQAYRQLYPTMVGRCDIYVGFIEAGIHQLKSGGALGFICSDRWMRAAYGIELRRLIAEQCGVEAVIEMHDAPAFENDVSAYPAVTILRRGPQGTAVIATAGSNVEFLPEGHLTSVLLAVAEGRLGTVPGIAATRMARWFSGNDPWPLVPPDKLALLQRLESSAHPLESPATDTIVGIGVATGADRVFITTDPDLVESDRLLPLAVVSDTRRGTVEWSGHFLVDPWQRDGRLVDLATYPKLKQHLEANADEVRSRSIARRRPHDWYRTIDRVHHDLLDRPKLYFPDMKLFSHPTLDLGKTYPHHNLYYVTSTVWDLEVLGGLLLSKVAQFFIEAYCVRMRGGTLRFQAQYLRRIRVPNPNDICPDVSTQLKAAFRTRDVDAATAAAVRAYGIADLAEALK